MTFINANYPEVTTAIKSWSLFFFMLPIKMGFDDVVKPFTYGFSLTTPIIAGYALFFAALAVLATRVVDWRLGLAVVLLGATLYFGLTDTPWPAFIIPVTLLAWQVGGWKTGLFALLGLVFMLITGYWFRTMLSVYLCGSAAMICAFLGVAIGIWAARNDRVSAIVRPINDTLQTIPLFVFLIPVLMLFKTGEFAGFLAIIMYAIVPAVRYTEHGIRNVNAETVEAAKSMGLHQAPAAVQRAAPPGVTRDHARHQPDGHVRPRDAGDYRAGRHPGPRPAGLYGHRLARLRHGHDQRAGHGVHRHDYRPHHPGLE